MKDKFVLHFGFDLHQILFLVNDKENECQVYENGKYIDTEELDAYTYSNIEDVIRRRIYLQYKDRHYDTKILYYRHAFEDEKDFDSEMWTLAWRVASWIRPNFWTTLTTSHGSGLWTDFIFPRAIVDNDELKIVRWLNYYFTKEKGNK